MLAREDIDAVLVLVPIDVLAVTIRKCLAAGKHVLSEKPLAHAGDAGAELVAWHAHSSPHVWGVAENYRYV